MSVKQKVLVVDDEARNQRIILETLEDLFDLEVAGSGEEALELLKAKAFDLVLLDIMMPGMSGYDVCTAIRKDANLPFTKVILVSGKAMIDERLQGYAVGADDYMTKPFVPEELMAKAKVFLRLTQIEKELSEMNRSLDDKVQEKARLLMEAEIKLMNSAKMSALGEMAGGVAHEINTPLATISLLVEQQLEAHEEGGVNKEDTEQSFKTIGFAAKHIAKIVQGLRFFSRDSASDPFVRTDLVKVIDETILLCGERFKSNQIRLEIEAGSCIVNCRPVQIAQVLLNLLNNSFHAVESLPEKWVQLKVQDMESEVEISVTDSGLPIPAAVREKLFQPFFTTKDVGNGTGLGLSISKGIAENHKGSLALDDTSPRTRFVLRLPKDPEIGQVSK
jgi:C4-dicarboxylate-specific signal transduction histidine kinase